MKQWTFDVRTMVFAFAAMAAPRARSPRPPTPRLALQATRSRRGKRPLRSSFTRRTSGAAPDSPVLRRHASPHCVLHGRGAFGARLTPRDAYLFASGHEVKASSGQLAKLSRPLDFLVVADHSDGMGFFPLLLSGNPEVMADPQGRNGTT